MKKAIKSILNKFPYIRDLRAELDIYKTLYPPGHYHSPIPSQKDILKKEHQIFKSAKKEIEGVDLNEKEQLSLLEEIKKYYNEFPYTDDKKEGLRYCFERRFYPPPDAVFLYSILRHFQPDKIIEVGCGFSSAVILDTNEYFLEDKIQCHFIDPYPERLLSLLKEKDRKKHEIITDQVQDVNLDFFKKLRKNDILFIDSSHVSKIGSDVNYIFFEILPNLNSGVLIHFHDIFYPLEYCKRWALEGKAWNEMYILHAFLQYNSAFKIVLFTMFVEAHYKEWLSINMPLCGKGEGGSIWLRKA